MINNYRILEQLQQHMGTIATNLQQTEDRKVLLQSQLNRLEALESTGTVAQTEPGRSSQDETTMSLADLRQELRSLESRYSDKHPDVIRLRATIEKKETEQKSDQKDSTQPEPPIETPLSNTEMIIAAQRDDLVTQLKLIDKEIKALREEKREAGTDIDRYKKRIEDGPRIEQMFVDLRRDYEEATENYQSLLQKKLQAELAENLERTQKGEQFRVLEPANTPQKPIKPNVMKVLPMGFLLALCFGLGLAYFREYMDPTFWGMKDVESVLGIPVLVSIPIVETPQEQNRRRSKSVARYGALFSMVAVLFVALFILLKTDPTFLPMLPR